MAKSELLSSILSIVVKNPKSKIQNRSRGVLEQYVAGSDTRGRPEGRSYPWSQQAIREISGLELVIHFSLTEGKKMLTFPTD